MALFNYATKEITLKVVYYGPGLSGKTTNIEYLHSSFDQARRGKLLSLSTETDRTLFFDFLPIEIGKIRDFSIRFQVYTVPGQVRYNATRKLVLKGADAIVFVADSQVLMRDANLESLENMRENLMANDLDPDDIPIMFQYNKRDLPNILSIEELNNDLNYHGEKYFPAVAIAGSGVKETFQEITRDLIRHIAKKHRIDINMREPEFEKEAAVAERELVAPVPSEPFAEPESLPEPEPTHESIEEEEAYQLEESEEIPEVQEVGEDVVPSDYFGTVGEDQEEVTIEVIEGLQNQEELMEESTHLEISDQDLHESVEGTESVSRSSEKGPVLGERATEDEEAIESIYKTFMSEEKEGLPPVDESVSETLEREEMRREEDSSLLKRFRESIRHPGRRDGGAESGEQHEEQDIFAELERQAREEEQRSARERSVPKAPAAAGPPEGYRPTEPDTETEPQDGSAAKWDVGEPPREEETVSPALTTVPPPRKDETRREVHATPSPEKDLDFAESNLEEVRRPTPPSDRVLSASESLLLDEINTISRTMRRIHDSMNAMKSETLILTRRIEEMEKRLASVQENSRDFSEMLRSGGGKILSDELAQAIMSLKASVDSAKKKKLWMFFS